MKLRLRMFELCFAIIRFLKNVQNINNHVWITNIRDPLGIIFRFSLRNNDIAYIFRD